MTRTIENFLQYVKIDTQSCENTKTTPSTAKQHDLAKLLVRQLETLNAAEITYDQEHCYIYATIPASPGCSGMILASTSPLWQKVMVARLK